MFLSVNLKRLALSPETKTRVTFDPNITLNPLFNFSGIV